MVKASLNDIDAQIAALERESKGLVDSCQSDSTSSSGGSSSEEEHFVADDDSFSGYSCDSSSSEESDSSEESEPDEQNEEEKRKLDFDKKAKEVARKKSRSGMSSICFKYLQGTCKLEDCIFRHIELSKLNEEEIGEVTRELHKRPYDATLGALIKNLNIPVCKVYSKTGECKFLLKCKFWHIDSENTAKWAGLLFWCESCWKAFTSEVQLKEHCNGKLHKYNIGS